LAEWPSATSRHQRRKMPLVSPTVASRDRHCDSVETTPDKGLDRTPSDSRAVPRFYEHAEIPAADPAPIGSRPVAASQRACRNPARVTPEHGLAVAVRRPMAELVAAAGVAVGLLAAIGGQVVFSGPFGFVSRTGAGGYRRERRRGGHRNQLPCTEYGCRCRCGRSGLCRGGGSVRHWTTGGVSPLIAGDHPSVKLIGATAAPGARIAGSLACAVNQGGHDPRRILHSVEEWAPVAALRF
jgi:hypothetical protein